MKDAVHRGAAGVVVVQGTDTIEETAFALDRARAQAGETLSATYGFVGGEIDLQRRGLIRAGWLDGIKARVLLSLMLRRGHYDTARICKEFEAWGA